MLSWIKPSDKLLPGFKSSRKLLPEIMFRKNGCLQLLATHTGSILIKVKFCLCLFFQQAARHWQVDELVLFHTQKSYFERFSNCSSGMTYHFKCTHDKLNWMPASHRSSPCTNCATHVPDVCCAGFRENRNSNVNHRDDCDISVDLCKHIKLQQDK